MEPRPIVPLGTKTQWGEVAAVQFLNGERYYFMVEGNSVAYMPASVVERRALAYPPPGPDAVVHVDEPAARIEADPTE